MADQQPDLTPDQTPEPVVDLAAEAVDPEAEGIVPELDGTAYDAGSITVLEGLEAVRKRPGMYIGSTGERGLHHLVWEIVDNAVDEALAGYADTIDVTLMENGAVRVKDNGRGIPTDIHPTEGVSAVELVLTQLHAGGKFGGGGYKVSGGLHGVGSSVVNALSTRLDVCVRQKGHAFRMSFDHGVPTGSLEQMEETDRTGTTITYWANADIFETVEYDYETIRARFQQYAFLNKGLRINLVDERVAAVGTDDGEPDLDGVDADIEVVEDHEDEESGGETRTTTARSVSYRYDNGLVDYVNHLVSSKKSDPVHSDVISIEVEDPNRSLALELAMQWTTAYSESVHSYANTVNTHEGGTHEEGFRAALTKLVNDFARKQNLLKDKDENLTGDDVREGLTAVISVKLGEPQFEGQTKTKLGNSEVKGFVQQRHDRRVRRTGSRRTRTRAATSSARRSRPPPPGWPPARRARRPGARGCSSPAACPASCATARPRTPRSPRCSSSRATRPAAPPCAGATRTTRRSSRSAARSSTSSGPASTRRWPTRRSRRSSRRSAPASARTSTSTKAQVPQDRADGRCRRRRHAHPHPAADPAVPVHEAAHRGRLRLPRAAAAVTASSGATRRTSSRSPTASATP